MVAAIEVGKRPCSGLAAGFGSVWVPVSGDRPDGESGARPGLTRVDIKTNQIPLSKIDPATNQVVKQWVGAGGDSVRVGHGSLWLSNLRERNVWRIDLTQL